MDKLIKKTVIVTVAALIAVGSLTILIFSAFFPKASGDFCRKGKMYGAASGFYARVYDKSGSAEDFSSLMGCALEGNKKDYVIKYGKSVLGFKDELSSADYEYFVWGAVTAGYECGNYAFSAEIAVKSGCASALDLAKVYAEKNDEYAVELNKHYLG
ncbi:MAG: hypothetical protein SO003_05195 [Candidatus Borkfalkiaceae bacterium]|nr:hypothetical protein [Christensenellaceae bacterium]